jgi:hypothetical protein
MRQQSAAVVPAKSPGVSGQLVKQRVGLFARDVIPSEVFPISKTPPSNPYRLPVLRRTRPEQTGGKGAFVAGLL